MTNQAKEGGGGGDEEEDSTEQSVSFPSFIAAVDTVNKAGSMGEEEEGGGGGGERRRRRRRRRKEEEEKEEVGLHFNQERETSACLARKLS